MTTATTELPVSVLPSKVTAPVAPAHTAKMPAPKRWTRDEYYALARDGYFRGKRVLLFDGEIIEMARQGNWHSVVIGKLTDTLILIFPRPQFWLRAQLPLDVLATSEPEPDVAIVPGVPDDYAAHPTTALLVVEVADSSLKLDRRKANAYAAAGVADYWIVDLRGHSVEAYRQPMADAAEPFGFRYQRMEVLRPGQSLSPVAAPNSAVAIADLLPKQPVPNPDA